MINIIDVSYFKKKLELILQGIGNYTPDELSRELGRLSSAASLSFAADIRKEQAADRTALEQFIRHGAMEENDSIERLRFFCSLAMANQDWIDSEEFFEAIITDRKEQAAKIAMLVSAINIRGHDCAYDSACGEPVRCEVCDALLTTEQDTKKFIAEIEAKALDEIAQSFEDGGYFFDSATEPADYTKFDLVYAKALRAMASQMRGEK